MTARTESEARFHELADNISQLAWLADESGSIYWYNRRWHDYTGTTLEEMQGWGWQKVHHPDHVGRVVERIRKSFESGAAWEDTFPLRGRDGSYRWFLSRALPIRNGDGKVVRWFGTNTDVTEQIAAENALREGEARFRELADNISQFAWTADPSGQRYWYNKRWYDYSGTTFEEMRGLGWQKLHHPEHLERVLRRMRRSFETGEPWEDVFPLRGRDGGYRWFLTRALPIRSEAGEIVRWFGTNTDVTEQREAEAALRALNETLEERVAAATRERLQIWNVSEDLLVVADLEGRFLGVNPAWSATLGWAQAELLGGSAEWLLHPDDRERTLIEFGHLAGGRRTSRFEARLRHRDGTYRWISWKAAPEGARVYAVGRDVTERRESEARLRETQRELAQVARRTTLAAMTASIAHEVNQPLAAIVANAGVSLRWLAAAEPDLAEVRSALKRIVEDGHRAGEIIANVRSMFRKDGEQETKLDVYELVRDVLALVQGELENQRVAVRNDCPAGLPRIVGERVPLQQVLLNLIMNAAEAMSQVSDRPRQLLLQGQFQKPGEVLLTVADCGTGIAPENMERIFDAFFSTKPQGMGMGLSICRSIVEAHGGRLWAAPRAPHGSIFHVQLPLR